MSSVELFFTSDESDDEVADYKELSLKRRKIRDSSNPLELPEEIFVKYMRVSKDAFVFLLQKIEGKIPPNKGANSVPPILKVTAASRFFAEGSYQKGDFNIGVAQSTFSKILKQIVSVLEETICDEFVKFPNAEEQNQIKLKFFEKFGFPGIVGCVDGTHVRIISPSSDIQHLYYNRKGYHSINVMLVWDHKMMIRYVDANNSGASHDSFIWNFSQLDGVLLNNYSNGQHNTWLLGDAGYPLKPYLITPFKANINRELSSRETRFNVVHAKARNIIERTIGVLKNTFRCLLGARQLHYKPDKVAQIINVCCALHNLRIKFNIQAAIDDQEIVNEGIETNIEEMDSDIDNDRIREHIMNSMF